MPSPLLDTNAVSDLMRGDPQVTARTGAHAGPICTSVIAAGEIRYGLERLPSGKKRTDLEARAQHVLVSLRIEPVTPIVADVSGRFKASAEGQGLNLDDNDLWIAATALATGSVLITRDQIFLQVPGLQSEDWSK